MLVTWRQFKGFIKRLGASSWGVPMSEKWRNKICFKSSLKKYKNLTESQTGTHPACGFLWCFYCTEISVQFWPTRFTFFLIKCYVFIVAMANDKSHCWICLKSSAGHGEFLSSLCKFNCRYCWTAGQFSASDRCCTSWFALQNRGILR